MLTIFTLPKPFRGDIGRIQRNAVRSWKHLSSDCQVILCGDASDLDEAAAELGVDRATDIACTELGTPLVSAAFSRVGECAKHDVLCYANADLIFLPDFLAAVECVVSAQQRFLIVGECWDVKVEEELSEDDFAEGQPWEARLRQRVGAAGTARGDEAIDFFVFRKGTIGTLPDLAVGRPGWDNWMIWRARSADVPVVDISDAATVVHQSHGYSHVPEASGSKWEGPEADANRALLDFRQVLFTRRFATQRLVGSTLLPVRPVGIHDRVEVALLLHAWTLPLYRTVRAGYRLRPRGRAQPENGHPPT